MQSYVMSAPVYDSINMKTFPNLGAFPGEVGSGNSPGGIGGTWPMQLPLAYWWNFGRRGTRRDRRGTKSKRRSRRGTKSNKRGTKSKRRSKSKCKKYLSKKIGINIREGYPRAKAISISYNQTKKKFPRCKF
jgi:hypothetical protein